MRDRSKLPSYCKHKASGRAYVTLNGHVVYLGEYDTPESLQEYKRVLAEWLSNGERWLPKLKPGETLSVAELILQYWVYVEREYVKDGKPTGEQAAIKAALKPVNELYGHVAASEFRGPALVACRMVMVEKGWKRYTVNKHVGRVRRMYAWAAERDLVCGSIYHSLLAVKGLTRGKSSAPESEKVRPVEDEHIRAVLPLVSAPVDAMIRLQEVTGMRPGEVVLMRPCDIDRSEDVWVYRPMRHKTEHHGHERVVFLGPRAQQVLEPFLEARGEEAFLFSPKEAESERSARRRRERKSQVPPSQRGRGRGSARRRAPKDRYDTGSYRRAIERACKRAGIATWTPHRLRHTAATRLQRKYGVEAARVVLGHESPAVTEVYVERDMNLAKQVMGRLG